MRSACFGALACTLCSRQVSRWSGWWRWRSARHSLTSAQSCFAPLKYALIASRRVSVLTSGNGMSDGAMSSMSGAGRMPVSVGAALPLRELLLIGVVTAAEPPRSCNDVRADAHDMNVTANNARLHHL